MIRAPKICGGSHIRAGLSGYIAELASSACCAPSSVFPVPTVRHADYIGHWLELCSPRHKVE